MIDIVDYPRMPDDWMPESLLVVAKHGECELGFVLRIDSDGFIMTTETQRSLTALRLSMWQAIHLKERATCESTN